MCSGGWAFLGHWITLQRKYLLVQEEEELCVSGSVHSPKPHSVMFIQQRVKGHTKQGCPLGKQLFSAVHSQGGLCLLWWVVSAVRQSRYIPMQNFLVLCQRVEVYT